MTSFLNISDVALLLLQYEMGEVDEDETITLFQYLIDTGMAWKMQGSYGRMAKRMIDAGLCERAIDSKVVAR
jgi:hypothetical protein